MNLLLVLQSKKEKICACQYILSRIIDDLEVIIFIQDNFLDKYLEKNKHPEQNIDPSKYQMVTFSFLILTLCKYQEFYNKYKSTLDDLATEGLPEKIYQELEELNIRTFRNKVIGHINAPSMGGNWKNPFDLLDRIKDKHKSLYAFYLKMSEYPFINECPLIGQLKKILLVIEDENNAE